MTWISDILGGGGDHPTATEQKATTAATPLIPATTNLNKLAGGSSGHRPQPRREDDESTRGARSWVLLDVGSQEILSPCAGGVDKVVRLQKSR